MNVIYGKGDPFVSIVASCTFLYIHDTSGTFYLILSYSVLAAVNKWLIGLETRYIAVNRLFI